MEKKKKKGGREEQEWKKGYIRLNKKAFRRKEADCM